MTFRERSHGVVLAIAIVGAVLTAVAVAVVDRPLMRVVASYQPAEFWDVGITVLEWSILLPVFKLTVPIALVKWMVIATVVPRWRATAPALMVIAGTHVITRFAIPHLKDATGRLRPTEWLAAGGDATFFRDGIAFPSGHVALFASLAIPIAVVVARRSVRSAWIAVACAAAVIAFTALARIAVGAHYPGDALGSIVVVALITWLLVLVVPHAASTPSSHPRSTRSLPPS